MLVRTRRHDDVDSLLKIAERVRAIDGYPPYLPGHNFEAFLLGHETLGAWVVEVAGEPVGQVALHPRTGAPAMALASEVLGVEIQRLGVLARLLVSPDHRRLGAARTLLEVAAGAAVERQLVPILDVATQFRAAIALYERCGWTRAGEVEVPLPTGRTLREYVYLAPAPLWASEASSSSEEERNL